MSDDRERPRSAGTWAALWLILVLVLYVASIGPVGSFVRTNGVQPDSTIGKVISVVYWPLIFAVESSPPLQQLTERYIELFLP